MQIAIDDTYGQAGSGKSKYVTQRRRTHLAVIFSDNEVEDIRRQVKECLATINEAMQIRAEEFHFAEIYNRMGSWASIESNKPGINLRIFEFFAFIYRQYRWPVYIQTVDDRTESDFKQILDVISERYGSLQIDDLNLRKREDFSLFMLLLKIKSIYKNSLVPINLVIDEGRKKPGNLFGSQIFHDWNVYTGHYQSSAFDPLLQIADFLAFCVNRVTHLSLKLNRTAIDKQFVELVSSMQINCEELKLVSLPNNFGTFEIDEFLEKDISEKNRK